MFRQLLYALLLRNAVSSVRLLCRLLYLVQARREPQQGPGKHSRGAPKHLYGAPLGKFFLNFFSKWYILAYFIFLTDGGAPKRRGARGS